MQTLCISHFAFKASLAFFELFMKVEFANSNDMIFKTDLRPHLGVFRQLMCPHPGEQQQHLYLPCTLTLIKFKKVNNISVCTQLSLELK